MAKKRRHASKAGPTASGPADLEEVFTTRRNESVKAITSYDQVMDSEDEFHEQRDSIDFESGVERRNDIAMRKVKRNGKNVWEQDFGQDDQVLGLDIDDSDEEDEEDDDEDDIDEQELERLDQEDERLLAKSNRHLKTARDYEDEDDEIIDRKSVGGTLQTKAKKKGIDEDEALLAWGRSRKNFYDRDDEVLSDEEAMQEELAETLKMQQRRVEGMDEADFFGDDDDFLRKKETFGDSFVKRLRGTAKEDEEDDGDVMFGGVQVEKVDTGLKKEALAKMDAAALKTLAETQIPEVVGYLAEFDERWDEIKNVLGPSLKWMKEADKVPTELLEAKKYLELKYRLLLSYLTNILFYLAMRANPPSNLSAEQIQSHPVTKVIANLAHVLSRLEKRVEGRKDEKTDAEDEAKASKKKGGKKDALVPTVEEPSEGFSNLLDRIADFVDSKLDDDEFGADDDGEEDEEDDQELNMDEFGGAEDDNEDDEDEDDDENEDLLNEDEMREVLATLKAEKSNSKKSKRAPVQQPEIEDEEEEEEEFVIPEFQSSKPSKAPKKKVSKKFASNDDFGEVDLNQVDMQEKLARKRDLQFHVKRLDQDLNKRASKFATGSGDSDIPLRDKWGNLVPTKYEEPADAPIDPVALFSRDPPPKKPTKDTNADLDDDVHDKSALDDEDYHGEHYHGYDDEDEATTKRKRGVEVDDEQGGADEEDDEALAYYNAVAGAKKARKDAKEEKFQEYKKSLEDDYLYDDNDLVEPGHKRKTGWTIDANKGLTPRRKKEDRNSRVKIRNKFAKKLKKLSSVKAIVKDKATIGAYRGETTGIKSNLAKSVKF